MSLSTGTNWLFTWLVSFTFPYLFDADAADLGARVGFLYGALTLAAVVWVWFLLPETAGRSLEEIHTLFNDRVPARKFKSKSSLPRFRRRALILTCVPQMQQSNCHRQNSRTSRYTQRPSTTSTSLLKPVVRFPRSGVAFRPEWCSRLTSQLVASHVMLTRLSPRIVL